MKKQYILYWNEQPIGKSACFDRLVSSANDCKFYDMYTGFTQNSVYTVTAAEDPEILYTI